MRLSLFNPAVLATLIAVLSAAAGVFMAGQERLTRLLMPLSGCLLAAVAAFGLIPELVRERGWIPVLPLVGAGYFLVMAMDRYAVPVCASCDHKLRRAGGALLIAAGVHAFIDGWGLVAVEFAAPTAGRAVAAAIFLHKVPEGLALGAILRRSLGRSGTALGWCALAEGATLLGGATGLWIAAANWAQYPLALAAGTFLFLGLHTVWSGFGERRQHSAAQ